MALARRAAVAWLLAAALALVGPLPGFVAPARAGEESPPCSPAAPCDLEWLWYSTSNGGSATGTLPDFLDLFDPLTEHRWASARARLGVFTVHESDLNRLDDTVVAGTVLPALARWRVAVNVDWGAATWASCRPEAARRRSWQRLLEGLAALRRAGVPLRAVSLQSVLSKPVPDDDKAFPNCPDGEYPLERRVADAVDVAVLLKVNGFGDLQVGIIDALVAHGRPMPEVLAAYGELRDAMAAAGERLAFVHLDHPYDLATSGPSSWERVAVAVNHLQGELGVAAGLVLVGSQADDEVEFRGKVLAAMEGVVDAGARPRHFHVWSWLRHPVTGRPVPSRELPEDALDPESPMTKNLLAAAELAERLGLLPER